MWAYGLPNKTEDTNCFGSETIQMEDNPCVSSRSTNSWVASVGKITWGHIEKLSNTHKHKQLKQWCQHSRFPRHAVQCPSAGVLNRISSDFLHTCLNTCKGLQRVHAYNITSPCNNMQVSFLTIQMYHRIQ